MSTGTQSLSRQSGIRINLTPDEVNDLNTVSAFLASPQSVLPSFTDQAGHTFVLAGNAILPLITAFYSHLDNLKGPITLIIAGGIGHSTQLLYDAITLHPEYNFPTAGKSEAAILREILFQSYPALASWVRLYIDENSTNCGSNAIEAKRLLDEARIWPDKLYIIQDPTMHRRTIACFEKAYEPDPSGRSMPEFLGWSFVPRLRSSPEGNMKWDVRDDALGPIADGSVWGMERFVSLVIGEIPRMRDDEHGYGPKGKGFITHIDIPDAVEEAWARLSKAVTEPI